MLKKISNPGPDLNGKWIKKLELKAEEGEWEDVDGFISAGGEAIVVKQDLEGLEVAVRVQVFDPKLFTEEKAFENFEFVIHLAKGLRVEKTL